MLKKVALFVFALGMGSSIAYARLPDCQWNCYLDYKACVNSGGGTTACAAERNECYNACDYN